MESWSVRVLVATPYPREHVGGVSSFVRSLEEGLRSRGADVLVTEPKGVGSRLRGANLGFSIHACRLLIRHRADLDVVHAQQLHPMSVAVGLTARILGKGLVLTVHGRSPRPPGLAGLVFDLSEFLGVRVPHRLIFVADSLRSAIFPGGEVIPIGVPVESVRRFREFRASSREELGLREDFAIGFVGRVTQDKGIWVLVQAFRKARHLLRSPAKLLLIGPTESVDRELANRIADLSADVLVLGAQTEPWRYLAAADVFVLPSFHEGLPLSLLEAMAMGIPPIATSVGDVARVIEPGVTGWLVLPGDVDALAAAITEAAGDDRLRAQVGVRASESVAAAFDWSKVLESYIALYVELSRRDSGMRSALPPSTR